MAISGLSKGTAGPTTDGPLFLGRDVLNQVNGGYIIRIRPAAMGIEVVPTLNRFRKGTTPGASQPSATPHAMAAKIQAVK